MPAPTWRTPSRGWSRRTTRAPAPATGRCRRLATPAELQARFDEPLPSRRPAAARGPRAASSATSCPTPTSCSIPARWGTRCRRRWPRPSGRRRLTAALNQSGAVWEMSPVGTIIETQVVRWLCGLAGLGARAGGTFTSGGTEATFAGLLAARAAALPDAWRSRRRRRSARRRLRGARPLRRHAGGRRARARHRPRRGRAVAAVQDGRGRARGARSTGCAPTAAGSWPSWPRRAPRPPGPSTTSTPSVGSCEARGLWLHVDGAHGASALFSSSARASVAGIHRARSIAWDPHKMMLLPLAASVVLVRDERDLEAAFAQRAPYLFHEGHGRARAGTRARAASSARGGSTRSRCGSRSCGTAPPASASSTTTCARPRGRCTTWSRHVPTSRSCTSRSRTSSASATSAIGRWPTDALDEVNLALRTAFNRGGEGWITTTVLDGRRVLRVAVMNPRTTAGRPRTRPGRLVAPGAVRRPA